MIGAEGRDELVEPLLLHRLHDDAHGPLPPGQHRGEDFPGPVVRRDDHGRLARGENPIERLEPLDVRAKRTKPEPRRVGGAPGDLDERPTRESAPVAMAEIGPHACELTQNEPALARHAGEPDAAERAEHAMGHAWMHVRQEVQSRSRRMVAKPAPEGFQCLSAHGRKQSCR